MPSPSGLGADTADGRGTDGDANRNTTDAGGIDGDANRNVRYANRNVKAQNNKCLGHSRLP